MMKKTVLAAISAVLLASNLFCEETIGRAKQLINSSDYREAIRILETLRFSDPDSLEITLSLGIASLQAQDYVSAERYFREVIWKSPDSLPARYSLAMLYEKQQEHLKAMDDLRDGIGLRAYGQRDPLVEYNREAYDMFQEMVEAIKEDIVRYAYKAQVGATPSRQPVRRPSLPGMGEGARGETRGKAGKIGRNDPCPCGSGKKFKKCCSK